MTCPKCKSVTQDSWLFCPFCKYSLIGSESANFQRLIYRISKQTFTFYERIIIWSKLHYIYWAILLFSILFLTHIAISKIFRISIVSDFTWFLCLMTAYIYIIVSFATRRIRNYFIDLYKVFNVAPSNLKYLYLLKETLGNHNLLLYGSIFGLLNAFFGYMFGLWYINSIPRIIFLLHFTLVGFICGIAIAGIVGVIISINHLMKEKSLVLNFYDSDKCFGTSKIGSELLLYSIISLSAGLLISVYIYNSPWVYKNSPFIQIMIYSWILFPHIAAITVLFFPVYRLHTIIKEYKSKLILHFIKVEQVLLNQLLYDLNENSNEFSIDSYKTNMKLIQIKNIQKVIDEQQTWPFNFKTGFFYVFSYSFSLIIPFIQVIQAL